MEGGIFNETTLVPISMVATFLTVAVWIYSIHARTKEHDGRLQELEKDFFGSLSKLEARMGALEGEEKHILERMARIETKLDILIENTNKRNP